MRRSLETENQPKTYSPPASSRSRRLPPASPPTSGLATSASASTLRLKKSKKHVIGLSTPNSQVTHRGLRSSSGLSTPSSTAHVNHHVPSSTLSSSTTTPISASSERSTSGIASATLSCLFSKLKELKSKRLLTPRQKRAVLTTVSTLATIFLVSYGYLWYQAPRSIEYDVPESPFDSSQLEVENMKSIGYRSPAPETKSLFSSFPLASRLALTGPQKHETCPHIIGGLDPSRYTMRPPTNYQTNGSKPDFRIHIDETSNFKEPYWKEACRFVENPFFDFGKHSERIINDEGDVAPKEISSQIIRGNRNAENAVLFLNTGNLGQDYYHSYAGTNPWHKYVDDPTLWCGGRFLESFPEFKKSKASVVITKCDRRTCHMLATLLEGIYAEVLTPYDWDSVIALSGKRRIFVWEMVDGRQDTTWKNWYWKFRKGWFGVKINSMGMPGVFTSEFPTHRHVDTFQTRVLRSMLNGVRAIRRPCNKGKVLVIDRMGDIRRNKRKLLSYKTGSLDGVLQEMCKRNLNVFATDLSKIPLREQLDIFGSTAVMVAVHGAGITNQIFMKPGSVVIEITLRVNGLEEEVYKSVVFADTALSFGLFYFTHDPLLTFPYPPPKADVHQVSAVYVNASSLATQTLGAYHLATCCQVTEEKLKVRATKALLHTCVAKHSTST